MMFRVAAALTLLMAGVAAAAADPALETFLRREEFREVRLSPSGRYLAAISPRFGRYNLTLVDLETRKVRGASTMDNSDVLGFMWLSDDRITFAIGDTLEASGEAQYRGRYVMDSDGNRPRREDGLNVVAWETNKPDEVIIAARGRTYESVDLYPYNIRTGARGTMLTFETPGSVQSWVLDRELVPRVAVARDVHTGKTAVWYRDGAKDKWRPFWEDVADRDHARPIAFGYDNKTMYVVANIEGDRAAIFEWDFEKHALGRLVASDPQADVRRLIFDEKRHKLLGYRAEGDKPRVEWFDPEMAALQRAVDAALPATFNAISWARDNPSRMLVFASSDRDPGAYYLLDATTRKMERLFAVADWIDPGRMRPREPVRYKARDGLEIPAYLTLPAGSEGRKVPLIVNVHGGPNVRGNTWGWDPIDEMLAAQGYAVLSPNFRGTTGLGSKLYRSGFKQWGLAMQDDLVDGARWLIERGIVDPERVCIMGGSYGGYATLYGLVRDPDFWRCGVAFVAVSDINMLYDVSWSDIPQSFLDNEALYRIGDPRKDAAQFKATSAVEGAARIKAPLLMAYGSDDVRVPLIHGQKMKRALDDAGHPYEWVVYTGEGHGFNKDANRFDFYGRVLAFLRKNLAP